MHNEKTFGSDDQLAESLTVIPTLVSILNVRSSALALTYSGIEILFRNK